MAMDKEFLNMVEEGMAKRLGSGYEIQLTKVPKANGTGRPGVSLARKGSGFRVETCLDRYYREYREGSNMEKILDEIQENCKKMEKACDDTGQGLVDFERVRGQICYRLVNRAWNRDMLKEMPFTAFHDLAVVFYVLVDNDESGALLVHINHTQQKQWGVTEEELFQLAKRNTRQLFPASLNTMVEILARDLAEQFGDEAAREFIQEILPSETEQFWVLSSGRHLYGASVLLYDGVLQRVAEQLGGDIYVIPSSLHEVLVLPYDGGESLDLLRESVYSINREVVAKENRLSDNVYLYRKLTGCLEVAGKGDGEGGTE